MGTLNGKVAIVTGGASGMGKSHVERLIKEEAKVVFTDLDEKKSKELVNELGENCLFIQADVCKEEDWTRVVDETIEKFGKIDVLVNNAGIGGNTIIEEMSLDLYMKVIMVDQVSVFLGMKAVIPHMKKQHSGSIINVSSTNAFGGSYGGAAYNSAKYAVRGLTKTAVMECADYGIRVNTVFPGSVVTPLVSAPEYADLFKQYQKTIPAQRSAQAEEISGAIVFLASDDSTYCNGAEIVIDGGLSAQNHALSDFVLRRRDINNA